MDHNRTAKYFLPGRIWWLLLSALFAAMPVCAAQVSLTPSLAVRTEYNDNLFFDEKGAQGDWLTTVAPALELSRQSERLVLRGSGLLGFRQYLDQSSLDSTDQSYSGTLQWRAGPRLAVSGEAGYQRDFRIDRDIDETGLLVSPDRRDRQRYGAGLEYAVSERSRLSAGGLFSREKFSSLDEQDSDTLHLSLGFNRELTERLRGLVDFGYSHSDFTGSRLDNLVLRTGLALAGSERLDLRILAGARYTRSRYEQLVPVVIFPIGVFYDKREETSDDMGWVAEASAAWRGEVSQVNLSLQREVRLASGQSGYTEVNALVVGGRRRLTERLSLSFSGGYYLNRAGAGKYGAGAIDERTLSLSPGLRFQWTPDLLAELNLNHTRRDDRVQDTEPHRNLVFFRLTYRYPMEF